jgi:hypothetical protein
MALAARDARADDSQQFELLKGLFYGGQYEEVLERLAILLDPSNPACQAVEGAPTSPETCHLADAVLIERSREMQVVALVALKRPAEADAVIEKMLRQNPSYSPEPGTLPPAVAERIRDMKDRMQKELEDLARKTADDQRRALLLAQKAAEEERKWLAEITRLASKETIIEKRSRLVAFVPFGVGQFQNEDIGLGILFAASETVTGALAVSFAVAHAYYASIDLNAPGPNDEKVVRSQVVNLTRTFAVGNYVAFSAWAALAVVGVIQANVAFVPEVKTTRPRTVPKRPDPPVLPTVSVSGTGVTVGMVGSF